MRLSHPFRVVPAGIAAGLLLALAPAPAATAAPAFSTYLGGGVRDFVRDVCVAPDGSIYVVGGTASTGFPSTPGTYDPTWNGVHDAYVVKLSSTGVLLWATFLGGPSYDRAYAVELDPQGLVVVAGRAGDGFPTTAGVVQTSFAGDVAPNAEYGTQDGFVAKLTPDGGTLVWATYFGDDGPAFIRDIAVDAAGDVYLVQPEVYRNHPHVTPGAYQTARPGGQDYVVARISADGTQVRWATYLGGSGDDGFAPSIRIDSAGNAFTVASTRSADAPVTSGAAQTGYGGSSDILLTKLSADGSSLLYGTFFGGGSFEGVETHNLWVHTDGTAMLAATTRSTDLPVTAGAYQTAYGGTGGSGTGAGTNYPGDGFVARFSADGGTVLAATYLGGSFGEGIEGCAMDAAGNVFVSGASFSPDFPTTQSAEQSGLAGASDYFVTELAPDLRTLNYSTLLGGSGDDNGRALAVTGTGDLIVGGQTRSDDWPLVGAVQTLRGGDWDGAVAMIARGGGPDPEPEPEPGCILLNFRVFPNPFLGGTAFSFAVEGAGTARLEVFDAGGRRIRRVCERTYGAGQQIETWDGRDDAGRRVPSGIYLVRLWSPEITLLQKAVRVGG